MAGIDDAVENEVLEAPVTFAASAVQSTAASAHASSLLPSTDFATDVQLEGTTAPPPLSSADAAQSALARWSSELAEITIKNGNLSDLRRILDSRADPHIQDDVGQNLAFFAAARPLDMSAEGSPRVFLELLVVNYGVNATAVDAAGQTPLFFAASEGDTKSCEYLISLRCDPDHRDEDDHSPLFYSAMNGRSDCAACLIKAKATLNSVDVRGQSPLFWASSSSDGLPGMVEVLLGHKANVHHVDATKQTALFYAETPFIAQTLLTAKCDANHCNARGQTAIHHAATTKSVSHIEMLAAHGADLGIADSMGWTCLFHAAETNRVEVCKLLLKLRADLLHLDSRGRTAITIATTAELQHTLREALAAYIDAAPGCTDARPYSLRSSRSSGGSSSRSSGGSSSKLVPRRFLSDPMFAERSGHAAQLYKAVSERSVAEVQAILESGVNPKSVSVAKGRNLMFVAAIRQHEACAVCSLLAKHQIDPTKEDAQRRQTPLYFAVRAHEQAGGLECARFLLGRQCDPNHTDINGQTPLFYAASRSDSDCVELLLAARASVNMTDAQGQTPLFYAVQATTAVSSLRVLLASRAEVATRDISGQSPLFYAQSAAAVELLLQHRADACDVDAAGRTALVKASQAGVEEVMHALIKAGGDIHATDSKGKTCLFYATRAKAAGS
eukprot:gnl/TRDRNA2_/TRDRNA2_174158_c0_seq20.p1 gnl/TRDRNA2_/TRDRNA2_174158_c0~~gnl/TRDRNA2_/TRDRNA2_174158_c0_seq20.p1  ORF type:complete len:688 (-),score=85.09 gnl/TRDRNA2_/TRDRNA2_174158_c0_seq20:264-2279(-)